MSHFNKSKEIEAWFHIGKSDEKLSKKGYEIVKDKDGNPIKSPCGTLIAIKKIEEVDDESR